MEDFLALELLTDISLYKKNYYEMTLETIYLIFPSSLDRVSAITLMINKNFRFGKSLAKK